MIIFVEVRGFGTHMDVFTQVAHKGETLKGCLINGRHAVEDEVGREKDRERENLSIELLVTVT